jgi:glycosyltransferase involved in cell wall biosynthesis
MITQTTFPLAGTIWNPGPPDLAGYSPPVIDPKRWAFTAQHADEPVVSVVGTVRNEAVALERSLAIWTKQQLSFKAELFVLDDGSDDDASLRVVNQYRDKAPFNIRINYVLMREYGATSERNCTLLFNAALQQLVTTPLVMFQWWDRIPGSFEHLEKIVSPHFDKMRTVTSAVSRHIGGSSSVQSMTPGALSSMLGLVRWRDYPQTLAQIAGPIGGHCVPGNATESSGFCVHVDELHALGGYDERYTTRANYSNVELWRRMLQAGLVAQFVLEPDGANYHQSHPCPTNRAKDNGWLHEPQVVRNMDRAWGMLPILEVK